ncbi:MAG TPA: S8 family serine peptidase [Gemmataceae bacterium]
MRKRAARPQQYVVLPTRGLRATSPTSSEALAPFLVDLNAVQSFAAARSFVASAGLEMKANFKVLDSIHEDGAKLVEMTADTAQDLQASQPGLRIVPVVYYRPALARYEIQGKIKAATRAVKTVVTVTSGGDSKPVRGATVVAFTDFANKAGAQGVTNAKGVVKLALGGAVKVERLYVYPKKGFWGALQKNIAIKGGIGVALTPVSLEFTDELRYYYGNTADGVGAGVTVGVVDTGVGPHHDLVVAGGLNCVTGEDPDDFGDNGEGHGTHVGGIIAARGVPPQGIRGLAPGVTLRSYRVFGKGAEGASNFAIAKAIDRAATDNCDLINLSLGGGPSDPATQSAIQDARQQGCLVVAAAGNDGRGPVSFPAADPLCIAVSALGRKGTFPKGSVDEGEVMGPFGTVDAREFIAAFSNVGPEVNLTGTGVGILSTVPGGYAPLSGTSMASPAVVGFAAHLLAQLPDVLAMPRNQARSDAIAKALLQSAKDRGFPATLQGKGLPLP